MSRYSSVPIVIHELIKSLISARSSTLTICWLWKWRILTQPLTSSRRRPSQRRKLGLLNSNILLVYTSKRGLLVNFICVQKKFLRASPTTFWNIVSCLRLVLHVDASSCCNNICENFCARWLIDIIKAFFRLRVMVNCCLIKCDCLIRWLLSETL
jgi:hypothetical protein